MSEIPNVELEITWANFFRVRKVRLTEQSSIALFGDLHEHRDCGMPPFDPIMRQVAGCIDAANTDIYNERMKAKYKGSTPPQITPGLVLVNEGEWDLTITNLTAGSEQPTSPDPICERR